MIKETDLCAEHELKLVFWAMAHCLWLLVTGQEMEENEEEDLRKLDKMFAEIDGDGSLALHLIGLSPEPRCPGTASLNSL